MRKLLLGWIVFVWGWGDVFSNDKMIMKNKMIKILVKVNYIIVVW